MIPKTSLEINIPENYQILYENPNNFNDSPFSKAYIKAIKLLNEIVKKQNLAIDNEDPHSDLKRYDAYNNIIAFTGERGIGKSSTMLSFMNSLIGDKNSELFQSHLKTEFRKINFVTLDVIDPSLFRGDESIFEMVLAQMFRKFKLSLECQTTRIDDDQRRKLIFNFQKVYDTFRITKKDNKEIYNEESIDNLVNLAKGSNLRSSFDDLIKCFLSVIGGKGMNKLVITIDDFDLKIKGIREMLEDIRQLLINNNIIILLAFKSDQLKQTLARTIGKEIDDISSKLHNLPQQDIEEQTSKYLEKILPNEHVIKLLSSEQEEIFKYLKKVTQYTQDDLLEREEKIRFSKISNEILLTLLFEKLDFYISKKSQTTSVLYTPNLRSLNELLLSIQYGSNNSNESENANNSKDFKSLKNYIDRTFTSLPDKDLIEKIWSCDPILLNILTLHYCYNNFSSNLLRSKAIRLYSSIFSQFELLENLSKTTNYQMIQFGDVASFFKILKDSISITDKHYTHFQIFKLIYNLRRRELIDSNPNYIFNSSLSGIIHSQYLTDNERISKQREQNRYRDFFVVNEQPPKSEGMETPFIQSSGLDVPIKYLNSKVNPYEVEEKLKNNYKNFAFNIYNYLFVFSLDEDKIKDRKNKLAILCQNTDFVIDVYEAIVDKFPNLSKDGKTDVNTHYGHLLIELEKLIKETILPTFNIDHINLLLNKNNTENLTSYFELGDKQRRVTRIEDIKHINKKQPFLDIINALEETKQYSELIRLFEAIDSSDIQIKRFLTDKSFIEKIKSDYKGSPSSTTTRKNLKEQLNKLVSTEPRQTKINISPTVSNAISSMMFNKKFTPSSIPDKTEKVLHKTSVGVKDQPTKERDSDPSTSEKKVVNNTSEDTSQSEESSENTTQSESDTSNVE
jgi:hypothetical protein